MNTVAITREKTAGTKWGWMVVALLALGGVAWYTGAVDSILHRGGRGSNSDRAEFYAQALAAGITQAATWPKSEADLLQAFWKCIAAKDYHQATIYCPGSKESDFGAYSAMPTKPEIEIGKPEAHPRAAGVTLWPIKVTFAGYGPKTIKLAINRAPDGRLLIDGQHSIWW